MPKVKNKKEEPKNPVNSMDVEIGFPERVRVELVQSNDLKHYEIFLWLASLFASASVGFWVAFSTISFSKILLGVSIVFSLFTIIFTILSLHYRKKMNGKKFKKIINIKDLN